MAKTIPLALIGKNQRKTKSPNLVMQVTQREPKI